MNFSGAAVGLFLSWISCQTQHYSTMAWSPTTHQISKTHNNLSLGPGLRNRASIAFRDDSSRQIPSRINLADKIMLRKEATKLNAMNMNDISESSLRLVTIGKETMEKALASLLDTIQSILSSSTTTPSSPQPLLSTLQTTQQTIVSILNSLNDKLWTDPTLGPMVSKLQEQIVLASASTPAEILVTSFVSYVVIASLLSIGKEPPPTRPYPLGRYDAASARAYFDRHLGDVIGRGLQIAFLSGGFGLSLLKDYLSDKLEENSETRAVELATLLTQLGPSFIKIGQSLSIRTDLLSPAYVRGLKTLQDQVPPFSTQEALQIIEEELGQPVSEIFSEIGSTPVAAASLGQVYRARLQSDGREVAIKVQRPNIMNQIALDMHFLRELAPWAKRTFNLNTDTVGTVDTWGLGFVDELDYISEAENGEYFTESIGNTPLAGVVFSPPIVEECTTGKILTTEWVIGERLDRSSNEDVTIICSIAMNSYLTMMLETGVLHCDPHPGNLLRTPEGKLCILDWGMVTRLDPDLQVTLIEHMAHLTSADYEEIPRDLLLLGFIPENKANLIGDSGIVEVLADIYGAWTKGGGAAAINVNKVVSQLQDLTAEKGNLFQIPPYFAYIAKSFSVLEGIGLSNDPNYSIINECLPYVSKRLLTDTSERTGGALSTFIFGPQKNDLESRIVDYDRVEQLISGFGDYTTSASGAQLGQDKTRTQLLEELSDQILELLATEEETPLQSIFLEQLAKIISSNSRSVWTQLREQSGTLPSGRSLLGTLVDPLGIFRTSPVVRMSDVDVQTVQTTRNLIELLNTQASLSNNPALDVSGLSNTEIQELASTLVRKLWSNRRGILKTSSRLATKLLQMTAEKLEKGERDVYVLPPAATSEKDETLSLPSNAAVFSPTTVGNSDNSTPSARLVGAKQLLASLEKEQEQEMKAVPTNFSK